MSKTFPQLYLACDGITNEQQIGGNTKEEVGGLFHDIVEVAEELADAEHTRQQEFENSQQDRNEEFEQTMSQYSELPKKVADLEGEIQSKWESFIRKNWFLNVTSASENNLSEAVLVPTNGEDTIHFEYEPSTKNGYYYIVTSLDGMPRTPQFAIGFEGRQYAPQNGVFDITIPSDGKYLIWQINNNDIDFTPSVAIINGKNIKESLKETLNKVVEEVDGLSDNVQDAENKLKKIEESIELKVIYDSIGKENITDGKFGAGTLSKTEGVISLVKTSGSGSGWSGVYLRLDTGAEFIQGHSYYMAMDILYESTTKQTINTNSSVKDGSTTIVALQGIDGTLNNGDRKLAKFFIPLYSSSQQGRITFQLSNYAVADDFNLKIYNLIFVDLTHYGLTYEEMDDYITTHGVNTSLSLIKESLHAKEADTAKSLKGNFKQARYDGKVGILMGDSHTTRRAQWIAKVFDRMGATWDTETNTYIIGKSTNEVMDGYEDTCTPLMSQATRLIEKYNAGKNIDVIFMENVHYGIRSGHTFDTAAPFKPKQVVNLGDYAQNVSEENTWFTNNINSLLYGKNKKLGTLLKYTFRANCSKITFAGSPKAGTINLRVRGKDYPTNLSGNETLNEAVALIFANFNNLSSDKVTINNNTITFTPNDGVYQHYITVTSGTTGITGTQTQESGASVLVYRYFDSRDIANWNDASHWYRLDYWNYGYGYLKGVVETLLEAIPTAEIIMLGLANESPKIGQFEDGLGVDVVAWHTDREYTNSMKEAFLEVGKKYNLKTIDVDSLSGLNPSNWFEFYNPGDVHPKPEGYDRWADVIIREMGV